MLPPSPAELMFNAYNEQGPNPWKTFDGRDVPRWAALTDQVRAKWEAAAAVFGVYRKALEQIASGATTCGDDLVEDARDALDPTRVAR